MARYHLLCTADMDPDFLDGIAMLERQLACGVGGAPQLPLQQVTAEPAATLPQAIHNQQPAAAVAPAVDQPVLRMPPRSAEAPNSEGSSSSVTRLSSVAAACLSGGRGWCLGCTCWALLILLVLPPGFLPSASAVLVLPDFAGGWSDTPDSACLAALDQLERQHAAGHCAGPDQGAGPPTGVAETPIPARQLTFTPTGAAGAAAPAAVGATPLSSGGGRRQPQLPTSHLGRSAMQLAEAALHQEQQAATVGPPPHAAAPAQDPLLAQALLAQMAQQQDHAPLTAAEGSGAHHPLPPPQQQQQTAAQQDSLAPVAAAGQKRMLAATLALERIHALHSPAAKQLQQASMQLALAPGLAQPPAAPKGDEGEPASKRLRVQEQPDTGTAAAAGPAAASAGAAAAPAAGPTAFPATDPAPAFDYRKLSAAPWTCCGRLDV